MLALTLFTLLSQSPQQCITVNNARVCGFNCVENGSSGACSQTPQGVCAKSTSSVLCFDPPQWLTLMNTTGFPRPTCVTEGTTVACGYDCKKLNGRGSCAQTPRGVCVVAYNDVTCFDPPPEVYGVFENATPAPKCEQRDGRVACGYNCAFAAGKTSCAVTPFGVCAENGSQVVCFDPSKAVLCQKGKSTPKPQCVPQSGSFTCGYKCAVAGAESNCAQTPDGSCDTGAPGKPTCFDPPVRGGTNACLEAAIASPRR